MNFFSHAAVAARFSEDPRFVLGAMLPDFASMLGVRLPPVVAAPLGDGVRFHHLTDRVFHGLAAFRALTSAGVRELRASGVERGPARAAAHVGIEILLDVALGQSAASRSAYLLSLDAGRAELAESLAWRPDDVARFVALMDALRRRGVPSDVSSTLVVERIGRALASRPRLALGDRDSLRIHAWVERVRDPVVTSTPALLSGLHTELERAFSLKNH